MFKGRSRVPKMSAVALAATFAVALIFAPGVFACHVTTFTASCTSVTPANVTGTILMDTGGTSLKSPDDITVTFQYMGHTSWHDISTQDLSNWHHVSGSIYSITYTFSFVNEAVLGHFVSGYQVAVTGVSGSEITVPSGTAQTFDSKPCLNPTAAMYSHLSVQTVGAKHTITWFSTARVLGFNVFAGSTRLNARPVTGHNGAYKFSTAHSVNNLRIKAITANGSSL